MNKKIKLLKPWENDGTTYDKGATLEVDAATAETLIADGFASEFVATSAVKVITDEPTTKAAVTEGGAAVTMTEEQFGSLTKKLVDAAVKQISAADPTKRAGVNIEVVGEAWERDPNKGYLHSGQWAKDVVDAGTPNRPTPKHLTEVQKHMLEVRKKALGSDEYASIEDSIGGFFVRPEFDDRFLTKGIEPEFVRSNGAMILPTAANMISLNAEVDKDRQTSLYGGVNVFWAGERESLQSAKGKFEQVKLEPDYLTGLYYVTDHLLRSAPAMGAIVGRQFGDAFQRKETLAFLNGNGAGQPLGVFNAPGKYAPARAVANEISYADVRGMRARCWDYANAVWVAGMGTYDQLATMRFTHTIQNVAEDENVGGSGQLVWHDNISGDIPATLLGRPVIFTEHASALGTAGDLSLVAWNHYLIAESPEFVNDSSIHVRYDSLETAFRFAKRLDAQPWWRTTLTVQNGWEMSPYVILSDAA